MNFLHDLVVGVTTPLFLVNRRRGNLNITTAAIEILLVLYSVLQNKSLSLIAEWCSLGRNVVPSVISGSAQPCPHESKANREITKS